MPEADALSRMRIVGAVLLVDAGRSHAITCAGEGFDYPFPQNRALAPTHTVNGFGRLSQTESRQEPRMMALKSNRLLSPV